MNTINTVYFFTEHASIRHSWWRHQMETFSALLAICAGNSPITGEFPAQRPVTRSFDVFFYLHLNKRLSKQSWGWWFETPSRPLWRHSNGTFLAVDITTTSMYSMSRYFYLGYSTNTCSWSSTHIFPANRMPRFPRKAVLCTKVHKSWSQKYI